MDPLVAGFLLPVVEKDNNLIPQSKTRPGDNFITSLQTANHVLLRYRDFNAEVNNNFQRGREGKGCKQIS